MQISRLKRLFCRHTRVQENADEIIFAQRAEREVPRPFRSSGSLAFLWVGALVVVFMAHASGKSTKARKAR
jgi:hypothetical protein